MNSRDLLPKVETFVRPVMSDVFQVSLYHGVGRQPAIVEYGIHVSDLATLEHDIRKFDQRGSTQRRAIVLRPAPVFVPDRPCDVEHGFANSKWGLQGRPGRLVRLRQTNVVS